MTDIIVISAIALIIYAVYLMDKQRIAMKNLHEKLTTQNNLSSDYGIVSVVLEYLGGHPMMSGTGSVTVTAARDALIWTGNQSINIDLNTLKSVEMKTEEQIHSDVTLSRLLLTGVFALAWKKKTVQKSLYLIFNFEEYSVPFTAIFRSPDVAKRSYISSIVNIITRSLIDLRKSQQQNQSLEIIDI